MQALASCRTQSAVDACKYRPEFERLELAEQLAMFANCFAVTGAVLWECDEKQKRLSQYIESAP